MNPRWVDADARVAVSLTLNGTATPPQSNSVVYPPVLPVANTSDNDTTSPDNTTADATSAEISDPGAPVATAVADPSSNSPTISNNASSPAAPSTHSANSRASRMCSRRRASMPDRPNARSTIQSLRARKRRPSCGPQSM